jgi:coproporphyrinogen III oxidase-like Fe-S oxidoreductase
MRREAVFAMKISEGLDTERFRSRYGLLPQDYFRTEIEPLIRQGLLETSANRILLTELGRLFSDQVAERFYSEPIKQTITKYRHNVRRLVGMEMASIPT